MKNLEYTLGPWEIEHRHCNGTVYDDEMSGLGIELIGPGEPMRGTFSKSADARLVVAAPEMYELLWRMFGSGFPGWTITADIMREGRELFDRMHGEQEVKGGEG